MADVKDVDRHYTGTLMLEATSYKIPKDRENTQFDRGSDLVISKMPSGEYAMFLKIHEYADTMVSGDAPNYPSAKNNPVNPASTDIKFKAYVRLDPEKIGISQQQLAAYIGPITKNEAHEIFDEDVPGGEIFKMQMIDRDRQRAFPFARIPEAGELGPEHLFLDENKRPVLNIAYGGWGQLGDPGGSDAIYTLNKRGINYQLEFTLPAAHAAAVRMNDITHGAAYDVQGFSHSTASPHTSLLAVVQGAGKLGTIMPGAAEFKFEEHEPVGGAAGAAVVARELGPVLYPQIAPQEASVKAAGSIIANVESVISESRPDAKNGIPAQSSLLRTYNPYFDLDGSKAVGGNVACIMFDGSGKDWNINKLDLGESVTPGGAMFSGKGMSAFKVDDFITGFMPHMSRNMGSLMQEWKKNVVSHAENSTMCVEGPMTAVKLANLGMQPALQTSNEVAWDHMLRDVQAVGVKLGSFNVGNWIGVVNGIIPQANARMVEAGVNEARPAVNAHVTPFAEIYAQLGHKDAAIAQAVKDTLELNRYGNDVEPRHARNPDNPDFKVTSRQVDGSYVLQITDLNNSQYGKIMFSLMEKSGGNQAGTVSVDRIDNHISINATNLRELGDYLDHQAAMHSQKVSDDLAKLEKETPLLSRGVAVASINKPTG